jgi:DNA (cytosine-5)-methyltransferase 1
MFNLRTIRHRYFECNPVIWWPPVKCAHIGKASSNSNYVGKSRDLEHWEYLTITGHDFKVKDARIAMGIDWMIGDELREAVPPAYTEWIGNEIRKLLNI